MKIAMIGSGAAGSVFAAYLKLGGAELWLVDRYKAHMDKIAADGLEFRELGVTRLLTGFHTAESAADIGVMDVVILMVKATQTDGIMPSVMPCIGGNTVVVSLQNGIGNDLTLSKYVGAERILYGFGRIGTELPAPGVCVGKPESGVIMRFGPAEESELSRGVGLELERIFNAGGCCTRYEQNVKPFVWKKAVANSGYNAAAAVLGLKVGPVLADPAGTELVKSLWAEGCAVAKAAGAGDLWPEFVEELEALRHGFGDYYPSMAQDVLLFKRQTEIMYLNGAIAEYGRRFGIPTPVTTAMTQIISCIQANYAKRI